MTGQTIFIPVLVQVLLTMVCYIGLTVAKAKAIKNNEVDDARRGLYDDAWPESVIKFNNNIRNQFEVPVLFYVLCFVMWAAQSVTMVALVIAWLFVLSRVVHAYIHTGSNYVPMRRKVFMFSCLMILIMLILAGVAVMSTPGSIPFN